MLYVIAILLLILVLSNEKASDILFSLLGCALWLAIIGAAILAVIFKGLL